MYEITFFLKMQQTHKITLRNKHLFHTHFLIELHGLVGATLPDAVPALRQHPHAAAQSLGPPGHTEHAQTQRSTLSCFDHGRCCFMVLHWDAVDLHDVVPSLEATATGRTVGHAVLDHQRAVSNDGEAKTAIRAGSDINLRRGKSMVGTSCDECVFNFSTN